MNGSRRIKSSRERLKKHIPLLQILYNSDPQTADYLISQLNGDQKKFLQDICRNFLAGNIPVSTGELGELKRQRRSLYKISANGGGITRQQGRGIFSILIPALATLLRLR